MILRTIATLLAACASFSQTVVAEDFSNTVIPITELKLVGIGLEGKFGTGFCIDPECRFIGTNYHVAMMGQPRKIKGDAVVRCYLATGPTDDTATTNEVPGLGPLTYTRSRDLAVFELRHPLGHHHGMSWNLEELQGGQEVDIYAYPKDAINPIRNLLQFRGVFKGQTTDGLLAFDYSLAAGKAIRPGASGGIVVDRKTQQIVGVLNGIAKNGDKIALAVSTQALADFLGRTQPFLAQRVFPLRDAISPVSGDFYPKLISSGNGSHFRPLESAEIKVLRSKAQLLADSMRNFVAVQTFAWGSGDKPPAAESAYEIQVLDGYQRFRRYPDGKRQLRDPPLPALNNAMSPGDEWAELPEMVGTELSLKILRADDAIVNGRKIMVFQYQAAPEDAVCRFRSILDFGFFSLNKVHTIGCYGEVWTDEQTNILRMSEHFELFGRWSNFQAVVTYGWLNKSGGPPQLIPVTISSQAELNKRIFWCRGEFTNYRLFTSTVRMSASKQIPPLI